MRTRGTKAFNCLNGCLVLYRRYAVFIGVARPFGNTALQNVLFLDFARWSRSTYDSHTIDRRCRARSTRKTSALTMYFPNKSRS